MSFLKAYRCLTYFAYPLISVYLACRKFKGKEDLNRFNERMGYPNLKRPEGKLVWIHGASVGETLSVQPLIKKIQEVYPNLNIMVTSGTLTSAELMEKRLTGKAFHQYIPIDCPNQVKRFVEYWKPDVAFWIESEFWPNLLSEIKSKNIPLILINGRVSDRSFSRWKKLKSLSHELQSLFTKSFGQTDEDARRLKELGAQETDCVGNMKFGVGELICDETELNKVKSQIKSRHCWVAGSTHEGEDEPLAIAQKIIKEKFRDALLVLAPRHPKRADEVKQIFTKFGFNVAMRSKKEKITDKVDVYIADTIGEMGLSYRLGEIAFVGGSLIPFGGQNMIEPARLNKVVLCGPGTTNFREIVAKAKSQEALIEIKNGEELANAAIDLLSDEEKLKRMQKNAFDFAVKEQGVTDRLVEALKPYLKGNE
ncbi:MAG: 3-deoxy-D-manno-octulosonic acid transferase [Alphaproteobacteria bacterium]|nr:3-deoxy-D-manno-octulosonic acid transferase [Alphaproteobacteria bacterium]